MTTTMPLFPLPDPDDLRKRAEKLGLYGLTTHFAEYAAAPWLPLLLDREEEERRQRGVLRRVRDARVGRFKPLADFDWSWPAKIDREQVEELFTLEFVGTKTNVVFVGPNGVGKTMLTQNLVYQAALAGHTARLVIASELLNDLAAQANASALARRLRAFCQPQVLAIDEVGYLSYGSHHADLLFEVISRRHETKSTIITTNRPFAEWGEVFPNASCVVALVDRLIHRAEVIPIQAESYRLKEAKEREAERAAKRASRRKSRGSKKPPGDAK
jgi:DNA replication protein DnaC